MKFKFVLIVFSCICCLLPACNNIQNQRVPLHLYAEYYVRYLESTRQIRAEASFTEGAESHTARSMTIDGGVQFLGVPMEIQILKKDRHRYIFSDTMAFPYEIYFQYGTDNNLNQEELTMSPIQYFRTRGAASKQTGLTLITNRDLLKGNENLVVLMADNRNLAASFTLMGPVSDTIHLIPSDAFQKLESGPGSLYLVKRMKKTMEQTDQTITTTLEYYTDTLKVDIRD